MSVPASTCESASGAVGQNCWSFSASQPLAFYGDQDGFGVGAVGILADPTISNAGVGEAVGTDVRLIDPGFSGTAFVPVGGFSFVVPAGEAIAAASLTMRAASFDSVSPGRPPLSSGASPTVADSEV